MNLFRIPMLQSVAGSFAQTTPLMCAVSNATVLQLVKRVLKKKPIVNRHNNLFIKQDDCHINEDLNGIRFTLKGLENTGTSPNVLTALALRGWTALELEKISSENFLRVFEAAKQKANGCSSKKITTTK